MIYTSFYLAIKNKLMDGSPALGIAHFDLWNEQIRNEEKELPFNFPAVFLEYDPHNWITLGNKKQYAQATFKLHIISEVYGETAHREGDTDINAALAHLSLMDGVFAKLQGFNGDKFGSITRTDFTFSLDYLNVKEDVLQFRTLLTDVAAMTTYTNPSPDPALDIDI